MTRRRHVCDVPGCSREREGWARLCRRCFRALPAALRDRILRGWKFDRKAWRAAKREAGIVMAPRLTPSAPASIDGARAYALANRITGDREDDWLEAAE